MALEHDQAPDHEIFTSEDIPNDPPLQDDVIPEEGLINTPASADPPASSVQIEKSHTPADKTAAPTKTGESKDDDVVITGFGHTSPGNPVALSKHSAKVESAAVEKGKWKTDLSSYAHLPAQELHSGYLNRLYTSRDYEAGLVNLMKEHYEVTSKHFINFLCTIYQLHCSPQGPVYLFKMNRDFIE